MYRNVLDKIKLFLKANKNEIVILLLSFLFIGLFSMSSPIYPFNDMADAHTWMIQGKMILEGQVLYKDIYEHKGPVQLIPYVIAAMFSNSFLVLYVIESLLFFVYGLFIYKIAKLYCKRALTVALLTMFFTSSSITFLNSGTTEELMLFVLPVSLYIILKALKEDRYLDKRDCIIIGILQGLLFWSKYTLCSFSFGLCVFMIYWHVKDRKSITKQILWFLMGVGIPTIAIIIYFILVGAFKDMLKVYFYNTIFIYPLKENEKIKVSLDLFLISVYYIQGVVLFLYLIASVLKIKYISSILKDKKNILIIVSFFITFIYSLTIGRTSNYYVLIIFPYIVFPLIVIFNNDSLLFKTFIMCISLYIVISTQNTHLEKLSFSEEDFIQLKMYDYIRNSDKHKILTQANNSGFFYYTDNIPFNRYFTNFCIILDDIDNEIDLIVNEGVADFIITDNEENFENYHLVIKGTAPAHIPQYAAIKLRYDDSYYLYEHN